MYNYKIYQWYIEYVCKKYCDLIFFKKFYHTLPTLIYHNISFLCIYYEEHFDLIYFNISKYIIWCQNLIKNGCWVFCATSIFSRIKMLGLNFKKWKCSFFVKGQKSSIAQKFLSSAALLCCHFGPRNLKYRMRANLTWSLTSHSRFRGIVCQIFSNNCSSSIGKCLQEGRFDCNWWHRFLDNCWQYYMLNVMKFI